MNKNLQTRCMLSQQIEKDYISNMLGVAEQTIDSSVDQEYDQTEAQLEIIDFNQPYTQTDFECQIFNIAGLNIAVATESISEIISPQQIIQNDGKQSTAGLFAGTISISNKIINVIDLEYLVMNGIANRDEIKTHECSLPDIVLLKGSSAGFIGNQLIHQQTISKQQVHWRDAESERIWLAGTVAQMGLALLDIEGVINLLKHSIK